MLCPVKTLGLIGGTTWHSTIEYYRAINEGVHAAAAVEFALGG
jgi:aspartate/glutamate racemase